MILQSVLNEILASQKERFFKSEPGFKRDALNTLPDLTSLALIVSGIRGCGKSTLLFQHLKTKYPDALYLNFEDPRLFEFSPGDFERLDETILGQGTQVLFFEKIQIISEWERYVRQKLDEGFKVVITSTCPTHLSKEVTTTLTGRHVTKELFPFSHHEFCRFIHRVLINAA